MFAIIWPPVFYFCLFIIILSLSNIKEFSVSRRGGLTASLLFLLSVGLIGYFTVPHGPDDLSRHIELIHEMGENGYEWCISRSQYRYEIIINHLFFLTAKIGNYHILVAFISVSTCAFLIASAYVFQQKSKAGPERIFFYLYIAFGIVFFRWIVTGLRNYFALSLFVFGFCIEYEKEKLPPSAMFFYLASMLVHRFMFVFLLLRLMLPLLNKSPVFKFLLPFWGFGSLFIGRLVTMVPGGFFFQLGKSLLSYLDYANYDIRLYIVKLLLTVIAGLFLLQSRKRNTPDKWQNYILFVYLFTLGSAPVMILFERSVTCMLVMFCPVFLLEKRFGRHSIALFSCMAFLIAGLYAYQIVDAINNFSVIKMLY